jgi:hypothetical protein
LGVKEGIVAKEINAIKKQAKYFALGQQEDD